MVTIEKKKEEGRAVLLAMLLMAVSFAFLFALNFVPGKNSREVAAIFSPPYVSSTDHSTDCTNADPNSTPGRS